MNKKKEIMVALKKMFGMLSEEAPAEGSKVYQESEIKISALEVGGKVELIDADGALTDAPDGDYEIADGSKFTVKDSLITAVEGQEAPEEEVVEEVAAEDEAPAEEAPVEDTRVADLEAKVEGLESTIAEIKSMLEGDAESNAEFIKQVTELNKNVKLLASTPAEFSQVDKSITEVENKAVKTSEIARLLGSLK